MSAVLLVTSGAVKVMHPGGIARALYSLGVPATYTTGRLIGGAEVAAGAAALAFGGRITAAAVALLYLGFAGFITVTLRSDSETEVIVYKVARLGRFAERALTLRPGTYTAVGTRDGYRDVRHKFTIAHDTTPAPVTIICTEPI